MNQTTQIPQSSEIPGLHELTGRLFGFIGPKIEGTLNSRGDFDLDANGAMKNLFASMLGIVATLNNNINGGKIPDTLETCRRFKSKLYTHIDQLESMIPDQNNHRNIMQAVKIITGDDSELLGTKPLSLEPIPGLYAGILPFLSLIDNAPSIFHTEEILTEMNEIRAIYHAYILRFLRYARWNYSIDISKGVTYFSPGVNEELLERKGELAHKLDEALEWISNHLGNNHPLIEKLKRRNDASIIFFDGINYYHSNNEIEKYLSVIPGEHNAFGIRHIEDNCGLLKKAAVDLIMLLFVECEIKKYDSDIISAFVQKCTSFDHLSMWTDPFQSTLLQNIILFLSKTNSLGPEQIRSLAECSANYLMYQNGNMPIAEDITRCLLHLPIDTLHGSTRDEAKNKPHRTTFTSLGDNLRICPKTDQRTLLDMCDWLFWDTIIAQDPSSHIAASNLLTSKLSEDIRESGRDPHFPKHELARNSGRYRALEIMFEKYHLSDLYKQSISLEEYCTKLNSIFFYGYCSIHLLQAGEIVPAESLILPYDKDITIVFEPQVFNIEFTAYFWQLAPFLRYLLRNYGHHNREITERRQGNNS